MCDRWDIGGLSTNVHMQTGRPTIFIYDGHPGGVGITLRGYEQFERLLGDAERLIGECPCESGCPSCVQSPKCGNLNEPLHKAGALELMRSDEHGLNCACLTAIIHRRLPGELTPDRPADRRDRLGKLRAGLRARLPRRGGRQAARRGRRRCSSAAVSAG